MAKVTMNGLGIELRGKAGTAVFAATRNGIILRPHTRPKNPRTHAQQAARSRFTQASRFWKTLTPEQHTAWKDYSRTEMRYPEQGGVPYYPLPHTLFIALASKYLQIHPDGTPPTTPPAFPFYGDGITLTASAGNGEVTFTASGPNSENIVTELLLQPLASGARAPQSNLYRPQAFIAFTTDTLTHTVTITPGWYAPAIRFVNSLSGQEAERIPLPVVQVT